MGTVLRGTNAKTRVTEPMASAKVPGLTDDNFVLTYHKNFRSVVSHNCP